MDTLQVYGFGQLRIQYRDVVIASFPTRHCEELLGYLLVNRRVHHNREKLVDLLWPRVGDERARARFSTVLWRLRAAFSELGVPVDAYLQVNRQSIAFAPEAQWEFDIARFEERIALAERQTEAAARERELQAAVSHYQAEPYEGLYGNWCLRERERLARLYLRAMGQLMLLLMQRRAFHEAIHYGLQILHDDPLREEVHRALMFCYWKVGDHRRATQQYETCAQLLQDELQIMPMAQTLTLRQRILNDRLHLVRRGLPKDDPRQAALRSAVDQFNVAAARLTALLEEVENR